MYTKVCQRRPIIVPTMVQGMNPFKCRKDKSDNWVCKTFDDLCFNWIISVINIHMLCLVGNILNTLYLNLMKTLISPLFRVQSNSFFKSKVLLILYILELFILHLFLSERTLVLTKYCFLVYTTYSIVFMQVFDTIFRIFVSSFFNIFLLPVSFSQTKVIIQCFKI